jgi:hypothetical protein
MGIRLRGGRRNFGFRDLGREIICKSPPSESQSRSSLDGL